MKFLIWLLKKSEVLSALSIRLVYLTGKSKTPIYPKHLIRTENDIWYKKLLAKNKIVLDLGCGSGQHGLAVAKKVKKVIGVDNSERFLKIALEDSKRRKIKNYTVLRADLEKKIPLKDNIADLIIMFDVLEHINKRQLFLKEVKRLLKRKGVILVAIPNTETSWKKLQRRYGIFSYSDPDHKIEYTKNSISKELSRAGFKIEEITVSSYDTPWVGFIDLVGGISLSTYKKISKWKKIMVQKHPENTTGFQIIASKL